MSSKRLSGKVREKNRPNRLVRILAFSAIVITVIFVGYKIISDNIQIRNNIERLQQLKLETNAMNAKNEQISGYLENDENLKAYIEGIARDKLDFANGDERIYYVVPAGN